MESSLYVYFKYLSTSYPREYHGIYIHIGEGSYFKVEGGGRDLKSKYVQSRGENLPTLQREGGRASPSAGPSSASRTKMAPACQQRRVTSLGLSCSICGLTGFPESPVDINDIGKVSPSKS